nr:zincin-like metallopeptidase domain-containing protein [Aeromonas veronii]
MTGHHSRLARRAPDEKRPFGSPEYAQEELRAEIASMFLTSMVGVEGRIQNHAKYTGSWLEVLKGDKHEIFRAARDAEKIVDHIFEYAPELREVVEARMADNLLPKEPPKRKLDSGISKDLPNFIPPEAKAQVRTGRDDPRWAAFDQTVRGEARKFGVDEAVVDKALGLIEPQFTEVMNAAKKNGYTADDMNTMLARSIVDEMRTADVRQQQWERFCDQVRQAGADLYPVEQIELALQELGGRYQQLIAKSTQEGWTKQQTDTEIRSMIFGEEGRRPITGEYVKAFIESSPAAQQVAASADSDDDFVLTPLGLSDAMPEDSGAVSDEHIKGAERYIMDDAEIQDINTP